MPKTDGMKEGIKYDDEKVRLDLVSPELIEGIAQVLTFGAKKYEPYNWAKGINYNRLYRALIGHMLAWWKGEKLDPESGLPHLWHAGCCLMFLNHYEEHYNDFIPYDTRQAIYGEDSSV